MSNTEFSILVCKSGHLIARNLPEENIRDHKFCADCGSQTIDSCISCNEKIKPSVDPVFGFGENDLPNFCTKCGYPFPWNEFDY